ncbi:hypothetical protein ACGYLM_18465 [Sulfitobacter sp. 1A10445]|uniref:hypothetical protein n=1 Tax=unclassified Sulfitobacter TaxID=196795 RepID=UPI00374529AE
MRLALFIVLFANMVPIFVGIASYRILIGPFSSSYVTYTLLFWALAALVFYKFCANPMRRLLEMLQIDIRSRSFGRLLIFVSIILIFGNSGWLLSAREAGIDNRGIIFKIFFLFEDVLFIAFILTVYSAFMDPSVRRVTGLAVIGFVMMTVFGRFGVICSAALVLVLIGMDRKLLTGRMLVTVTSVILLTTVATTLVEATRMDAVKNTSLWSALGDRVGEMATLSVVDHIFSQENFDGFSGFGNLIYLYAPSIVFPEKPIINDGSVFLLEAYSLGVGENGTRFPIMLHVDSYRRFGWGGIVVALLPALLFRLLVNFTYYLWSQLRVPFLGLALLKYFVYIYPKSILGLIEIGLYTYIRSSIVILLVYFIYCVLLRYFPVQRALR